MLFLTPRLGETLRVNGTATISTDPALLARFVVQGKPPKCVVVINVETVFFQCARAIHRSQLWQGMSTEVKARVPSAGEILAALTDHQIDSATYDRELPARQQATLY